MLAKAGAGKNGEVMGAERGERSAKTQSHNLFVYLSNSIYSKLKFKQKIYIGFLLISNNSLSMSFESRPRPCKYNWIGHGPGVFDQINIAHRQRLRLPATAMKPDSGNRSITSF